MIAFRDHERETVRAPALSSRRVSRKIRAGRRTRGSRPRGPQGEILGYLGPNGAGKMTTTWFCSHCSCRCRGVVRPKLTGIEIVHLLGRVQGRVDENYPDELTQLGDRCSPGRDRPDRRPGWPSRVSTAWPREHLASFRVPSQPATRGISMSTTATLSIDCSRPLRHVRDVTPGTLYEPRDRRSRPPANPRDRS
jgi:hypothetical protein